MSLLEETARRGADRIRDRVTDSARRVAASAVLWVASLVFLCVGVGFGALAGFIALSTVYGPALAAAAVAGTAGLAALLMALLALPRERPAPRAAEPQGNRAPAQAGQAAPLSSGGLPGLLCLGALSGFLDGTPATRGKSRETAAERR